MMPLEVLRIFNKKGKEGNNEEVQKLIEVNCLMAPVVG